MSGRVPDGGALYDSLVPGMNANPPGLPPQPAVQTADQAAVIATATQWRAWYEGLFSDGQAGDAAWNAPRLEHSFAASARLADGTDATLEAAEFPGGRLDWDAMDLRAGASLGPPPPSAAPVHLDVSAMPAPVRFRGMPAPRFWQFEDGKANLAGVTAGVADLARIVMLEFGLVYGNDWLLVPLSVPVGAVCRIASLEITDSFGQTLAIRHYSEVDGRAGAWRMYSLSPSPGSDSGQPALADAFVLPPVTGRSEAGAPVEEVRFLRDQIAAMAWAVERVVEGPAGRPLDRFEGWQRQLQETGAGKPAAANGATTAAIIYRLATGVPDYWIPFVPVVAGPPGVSGSLRLQLGAMLDEAGAPRPLQPRGRILSGNPQLLLYDEEVPRTGALVTRRYRYARWGDGSGRLWSGREKQPGKGEGSSGLRFDVTEPAVPAIPGPPKSGWTWGYSYAGILGDGGLTAGNRPYPGPVSNLAGLTAIAAGAGHNLALRSDGTVWAWGNNGTGQLGDGTTTNRFTPVQVPGLNSVIAVAAGWARSLALRSDGTVWAWGENPFGQLGDGTTTEQHSPVQVSGLTSVVAIAAGKEPNTALTAAGTLWAWGLNNQGQVGDGTQANQRAPVAISGVGGVVAIARGHEHGLALSADGTVWAWGSGWYGRLGDGTYAHQFSPIRVPGLSGVAAISGGGLHSLALGSDGKVWAWGWNDAQPVGGAADGGQIGDGTTTPRLMPVRLSNFTGVVAIAAGGAHSLALKADGSVWAWGYNAMGQIGDGTVTARHIPVRVSGLGGAVRIAAGVWHSMALA
jgi:hypothetical protein